MISLKFWLCQFQFLFPASKAACTPVITETDGSITQSSLLVTFDAAKNANLMQFVGMTITLLRPWLAFAVHPVCHHIIASIFVDVALQQSFTGRGRQPD